MNVSDKVFPYFWHWDETEKDNTIFRVYSLDKTNKTVCLLIDDFKRNKRSSNYKYIRK